MFKKFKDKLAEEMKQSPARLQASMQQLAQAVVSPALSNSSIQELSTSNDNFSLTEEGDETPKNSPARHGFHNVDLITPTSNSVGISRRSSMSSITSDTSSLFPIYESPSNLYHLQSDMDQSASEVDENISPQLDKISKDQLYSAYQKVQGKYHKYRGRYADLATHYRELERVKGKLESVLVETQDKVLRRIADLKEQCQLEQQAKAHIEEALRNDIEEKDHIINTLNTKIKLLQTNGPNLESSILAANDQKDNSKESLIDLSTESSNSSNENPLLAENVHLKDKLRKLENVILKYKDLLKRSKEKSTEIKKEKNDVESEYEALKNSTAEKLKIMEEDLTTARAEIVNLTDQVNILKKREEESVISLAENKLSVHRELEDKEEQIKQLRLDLKHMTETKDNFCETIDKYKIELESLKILHNSENVDPDKKEIIQDISRGKSEALKLMQQEMQQKLINLEMEMGLKYHEEVDRNKELLTKLEKYEKENIPEKAGKFEESESLQTLKSELHAKETELREMESRLEELQKLSEGYRSDRDKLHTELPNCKLKYKELKSEQDAQKIVTAEKNKEAEATIEKLHATIQSMDKELENMRGALTDRDKVCENFSIKVREYAAMLEKTKEKLLAQELEIKSLKEKALDNTELSKLQDELENKSTELLGLHGELKSCKSTISDLKDKLQAENCKIELLGKEKNSLLTNILYYKNSIQRLKEDCVYIKGNIQEQVSDQNDKISVLNKTLLASLTYLEEDNALQKNGVEDLNVKLKEFQELEQKHSELRIELTDAVRLKSMLETDLQQCKVQLNEMSIKLEEKNKLDAQNCKLIAEIDNLNFKLYDLEKLRGEVKTLREEARYLKEELNNVTTMNQSLSTEVCDLKTQLEQANSITKELDELKQKYAETIETITVLQSENANRDVLKQETQALKSELQCLKDDLCKKDDEIKILNEELNTKESCIESSKIESDKQTKLVEEYTEKIANLERDYQVSTEKYEEQVGELTNSVETLQATINTKLAQLKKFKVIRENQNKTIEELNNELEKVKTKNNDLLNQLIILEKETETLKSENIEMTTLKDNNSAIAVELEKLKSVRDEINMENKNLKDKQNELLKCNQELHDTSETMKKKVGNYEKDNQQLLNNNTELQNKIESYKSQLTEQNVGIENLRSQLDERNRDIENLNVQLAAVTAELQSKIIELNSQIEELTVCKKKAEDVQESLTIQNKQLCDEISELTSSLRDNKSIEETNKELLKNLEMLEKKVAELQVVEEENTKLKLEVSQLNDKAISLGKVQLQNSELIAEQASLRNKIIDLENVNADNIKLQSYVNNLKSKITNLEQIESESVKLKSELDTLKAEKDSQNTELMLQIKNLNVDNERLTLELNELKFTVDEKVAELKLLDTRNLDLLKEVERLKDISLSMEEQVKEAETLRSTISILEEKITQLMSETEALKISNTELQKEVQTAYNSKTVDETLLSKVNNLQEDKKKLEAQLDEALITFQAKESQMQIVNDELKDQTDKLKEDLKTNEEEQSMRLKQLVKEFQAQLQDKEEELQAALEKRFDRQQNYESNLIQQYKEQLKDFQIELTAKSEQMENLILENKEVMTQKGKDINQLMDQIALIKKEHTDEIKEIERKWKAIVQQKTDKLEAKHEEEINELTREWRNERKPDTKTDTNKELESTSRVAMAAVQSNTGSFHTLQQTLTAQRRELAELRKIVKLRHDTLEDSTEIEYLRNILFEYMMGRETMVLARVIAAVVKFDQEQTTKILKKEEDKMTLLGSLGLS